MLPALAFAAILVGAPKQVTFSFDSKTAKKVTFASDCYGWDSPKEMTNKGATWSLSADLPDDVRIEYQFVVDGKFTLDPKNPAKIDNGVGGFNSVYQGPKYSIHVKDQKPGKPMRRIAVRLGGEGVPERDVVIFVPRGPYKDVPIFIYADGGDYETRVKPQNILANLFEEGKIPPVILVLIPPVDRMAEYWKNSAPFEKFAAHTVLDEVRELIPSAAKDADKVFVGGASLGGHIAMRLVEDYPDRICGGVQSQSGAFWASPGVLSKAALQKMNPKTKLYFDWGTFEGVLTESNEKMTLALDKLKHPLGKAISHEGHNWTAWKGRFEPGILYLLGNGKH